MEIKQPNKEKVIKAAKKIIASLPEPPLAWHFVGSWAEGKFSYHDIDIYLLYPEKKEWMVDRYVTVKDIPRPFDLFFYVPEKEYLNFFLKEAKNKMKEQGLLEPLGETKMRKRVIIIPENEDEEREILEKLGKNKEKAFEMVANILGKHCTPENIEKCKEYAYKIFTEPNISVIDFLREVGVSQEEIENIIKEANEYGLDISKPIRELIGG